MANLESPWSVDVKNLRKDNVWSLPIIGSMSNLMSSTNFNNFKVAACTLEALSKVYGLRVDCVHDDVLRLYHGLSKKKIIEMDSTPVITNEKSQSTSKRKRWKIRKTTLTSNTDAINGKFSTMPFADPILAKLSSRIGGVNRPSCFLQNILNAEGGGCWKMFTNDRYWIDGDSVEHSHKLTNTEMAALERIDIPIFDRINLAGCVFRAVQFGYEISNVPTSLDELQDDDEDIEDTVIPEIDYTTAFDMEAEFESVPEENHVTVDVDVSNLSSVDVDAVSRCAGFKRKRVVIDDLRPINSISLEYSYRSFESIKMAVPFYWKFSDKPVSTKKSIPNVRKKTEIKRFKKLDFTLSSDHFFKKIGRLKLKKTNLYSESWNLANHKLPDIPAYRPEVFDQYTLAPNLPAKRLCLQEEETGDENNNMFTDMDEILHMNSNSQGSNFSFNSQHVLETESSRAVMEIADSFEGAPNKVTKIEVAFAKRAKVIDMKELKRFSLESIANQLEDSNDKQEVTCHRNEILLPGVATFSEVYSNLNMVLSKTRAKDLTPSVAFYSVLHLCAENNLRLFQMRNLNDFEIRKSV